ncbi:MAG TPA: methylenetetrahydrofolate reductase C-terminal domain-containing protein [Spirochaetota bacterium]|nr:methylenetetrahydrofolate reductase C-terminal domain-containing protein [Spirochaetota bacterium]
MIKAKRKPLEEIFDLTKKYSRILCVGCGGCTSVCLAGGQRETLMLKQELSALFKQKEKKADFSVFVTERQCNPEYISDIEDMVKDHDCIISTACGAGVQMLAERYSSKPVFPALNTMFIGLDRSTGLYQERCRSCGDCQLGYTGGICPVTCCSKSLFNGPCGGTNIDGSCELSRDIPCAWNGIYERLKAQNRVENILSIHPPMDWTDKGPGTLIQAGYENRYIKK